MSLWQVLHQPTKYTPNDRLPTVHDHLVHTIIQTISHLDIASEFPCSYYFLSFDSRPRHKRNCYFLFVSSRDPILISSLHCSDKLLTKIVVLLSSCCLCENSIAFVGIHTTFQLNKSRLRYLYLDKPTSRSDQIVPVSTNYTDDLK